MRWIITLLLATSLAAAGCLGGEVGENTEADASAAGAILPDLSDVEEPALDVDRLAAWHADFVTTHVKRDTGSPTNTEASDQLLAEFDELGWETEFITYLPTGIELEEDSGYGINVVIATKPGTVQPDHAIAWVSHYDTEEKTIQGAYDDGSGVAMGMELARELDGYENRKTLKAIFFDSEEMGLVASDYFVNNEVQGDTEITWDLVIGHDMVGINCPGHEWKMYQMLGENFEQELRPYQEALYYEKLGYDESCVKIWPEHIRNSDERRFKEVGIPIIRMAGGLNASDYPQYHMPQDTVDYIHDFVGGEENWKAGLRTVLEGSYWNVVVFDRIDSLVAPS
ncbi:MAG: M28 family peptidase [Candidatus Thermoplasmatota archaeon]|nr:M28 family peptidase [Candidatus Thermoplasmatota archaeon]